MMIEAQPLDPPLDEAYRQTVRAAAGADYLRRMTERCLDAVDALAVTAMSLSSGTPQLLSDLHRLAGGTAAIGLPSLAGSLRALEDGYRGAFEAAVIGQLWAHCRASAQAGRAALRSEGS